MKIPTVTGLVDASQLGYTLIHEHAVTCCDWSMRMCLRGQFCQEDRLLEMAVIQLKRRRPPASTPLWTAPPSIWAGTSA